MNRRQFIKTSAGILIAAGVPLLLPKRAEAANWFADSFTDTNYMLLASHVPDTGTSWSSIYQNGTARLQIFGNTLILGGGATSEYEYCSANGSPASSEFDISFTVDNTGFTPGNFSYFDVQARRTSGANLYQLIWTRSSPNDTLTLNKYVGGVLTEQLGYATVSFSDAAHTFIWHIRNTDKNVYMDGSETPIITSGDNAVTGVGDYPILLGMGGPLGSLSIDDFVAANYSSAPPNVVKHRGGGIF